MTFKREQNIFGAPPSSSSGVTVNALPSQRGLMVTNQATSFFTVGVQGGTLGAATAVASTATEPYYVQLATAAAASSAAGILTGSGGVFYAFTLGVFKQFRARIQLPNLANERIWICATDVTGGLSAATLSADIPAANIAGFRYSTAAGDTKWNICAGTGIGNFSASPESGNHLDTNGHTFQMTYDGINLNFFIDGQFVGLKTGIGLPASGQGLHGFIRIDNVALANAKAILIDRYMYETI